MPTGRSQERRGQEQEKGEIKAKQASWMMARWTNGIQGTGWGRAWPKQSHPRAAEHKGAELAREMLGPPAQVSSAKCLDPWGSFLKLPKPSIPCPNIQRPFPTTENKWNSQITLVIFPVFQKRVQRWPVFSLPPIFYFEKFPTYRKIVQMIQSTPLFSFPRLTNC